VEACAVASNLAGEPEPFRCVAIVGVGLIGGSLGMALRSRGFAMRVIGIDRSEETLSRAVSLGAIDTGSPDLDRVAEADCVVFATPVGGLPGLLERASEFVQPGAILTDVGSVKRRIVSAGERLFGARFVGGHPMSGSEASGVDAARGDLFENAPWAITVARPATTVTDSAVQRIVSLVSALGARPVYLSPADHDCLVGLISHLPHVLSFAFARAVSVDPRASTAVEIAGGSYRDMIRVSRSSPELWADILHENRDVLADAISDLERILQSFRAALQSDDKAAVYQQLLHKLPE